MRTLLSWGRFLARPVIPFYVLLWLMVLLVLGTVAQKYVGLYAAQQTFFFSWILFVGPLPGGLTTLAALTVCLAAKLFLASPWVPRNAGILMAHAGILILLIGGLLTFVGAKEGSMMLFPGDRAGHFNSYTTRELAIENAETGETLSIVPEEKLKPGAIFSLPNTPATIEIVKFCTNCDFVPLTNAPADRRGMAARMDITPIPPETVIEENRSALQFRATGTKDDGIYFTTDFIDKAPHVTANGKTFRISLRRARTTLPFSIELLKFTRDNHPGTEMARSYASDVVVHDQGGTWRGRITMNEPLRYRGYTIYQSSFISTETGDATVLAVVENTGRLFPYIASLITSLGLLLHIILRLPPLFRRALPGLLLALCLSTPTHAADKNLDLSAFARLPILDEGRIKPLDSFARTQLTPLIGRDHLNDAPAIYWLAEVLFDPKSAYARPVFRVPDPRVRAALSLPDAPRNRYAYKDLASAFYRARDSLAQLEKIPEEKRAEPQQHLFELFQNTQHFALLSRSFSLFNDKNIFIEDTASTALRILPGENAAWLSPWEQARTGAPSTETKKLIGAWRALGTAWQKNDPAAWNMHIKTIETLVAPRTSQGHLTLESDMNTLKPFRLALILYALSFLILCARSVWRSSKWPRRAALGFLYLGFALYITGLVARMILMDRPPVTNLYSSVLFVAGVAVLTGWLAERRLQNTLGLSLASFSGSALLLVAGAFSREGDTLGVLPAVLDTNFWLSTHVTMMTAGYALSLVAGLMAHAILARNIIPRPAISPETANLNGTLHILTLAALLATTTGTVLGGIWADQSWGRFWGWDPKENGALLIVLWILAALHGRLSGHLNQIAYTAFLAFLPIVVALAWFGVNLLGVGLHSYGFTKGAATTLALFCASECAIIGVLFFLNHRASRA